MHRRNFLLALPALALVPAAARALGAAQPAPVLPEPPRDVRRVFTRVEWSRPSPPMHSHYVVRMDGEIIAMLDPTTTSFQLTGLVGEDRWLTIHAVDGKRTEEVYGDAVFE